MTFMEIPLTEGAQSFTVDLAGMQFRMTLVFREAVGGGWFLDMERIDEEDAVFGIPLLPLIDLLGQQQYKGFGHLYVLLENGKHGQPTFEDMGTAVRLFWSDEAIEWNMDSGSDSAS